MRGGCTQTRSLFFQKNRCERWVKWKLSLWLVCLLCTVTAPGWSQVVNDYYITTLVGVGSAGLSGDGGTATSAELNNPASVAADEFGNLYIADTFNNRIRKISPDGTIATVAGSSATESTG